MKWCGNCNLYFQEGDVCPQCQSWLYDVQEPGQQNPSQPLSFEEELFQYNQLQQASAQPVQYVPPQPTQATQYPQTSTQQMQFAPSLIAPAQYEMVTEYDLDQPVLAQNSSNGSQAITTRKSSRLPVIVLAIACLLLAAGLAICVYQLVSSNDQLDYEQTEVIHPDLKLEAAVFKSGYDWFVQIYEPVALIAANQAQNENQNAYTYDLSNEAEAQEWGEQVGNAFASLFTIAALASDEKYALVNNPIQALKPDFAPVVAAWDDIHSLFGSSSSASSASIYSSTSSGVDTEELDAFRKAGIAYKQAVRDAGFDVSNWRDVA